MKPVRNEMRLKANLIRMKIFRLLLLLLGFTLSVQAQPSTLTSNLDKILAERFPSAIEPGAAVLVMHKGKPVLRKGYGAANLETKAPIQPDMVFRIGSITKQFTSTAILKLVQEGKINLKDPVTNYLPDFKTPLPVTVEQLLNHTSGIKSYTSIPEKMNTESKKENVAVADMVSFIQKQQTDFAPGEQWLYNNSGYYLLGAIIEKVSGKTYKQYITDNFFKPLGMKSSFVDDVQPINKLATGYARVSAHEFVVADYVHPTIPYAAGSIFSTVDDLYKWNQAVFSFKLVNKALMEAAWSPTKLNSGTLESYGYGWQLGRIGEQKAIGHGGGIDGFVTFEVFVPAQQIYVCVLVNTVGVNTEEIAYTLAERVAGVSGQKPTAIAMDEKALLEYTGVYQVNPREERVIRLKDGKLYSQRTVGNMQAIFPVTTDQFMFEESSSRINFRRDAEGRVSSMEVINRSWVNAEAKKTNKAIPQERTEIKLDAAIFDRYVGEYELAPGFILKIWREGERFMTQATGQAPLPIFPESETQFFLKVVDAQVRFNFDETGNVNSLTLFQGGREMPAKKVK